MLKTFLVTGFRNGEPDSKQGLIILDRFLYILIKNREIKNSLIDLASVIK